MNRRRPEHTRWGIDFLVYVLAIAVAVALVWAGIGFWHLVDASTP